jgi:ribulose-phosphate 3-epimerase
MVEIIPAILEESFEKVRESIARVVNVASMVQIDVCDGKFVPHTSWPIGQDNHDSVSRILNEEEGLPYWDAIDFEFDLMVVNAHEQFDFFVRLGAKRVIFHLEAETDRNKFKEFLEAIDMYTRETVQIGVAINTATPIIELESIISNVDFVQCMGIEHIGKQGEPFDESALTQISSLREKYPELIISVDGSVNEHTAPLLVKAGANRLVVGSALMHSYDVRETMREFEELTK